MNLTKQEVELRLEELTNLANERMNNAKHLPGLVYAGIFWMTDDEVEEHHNLVNILQEMSKQSSEQARVRIQEKIKKRKSLKGC